MQINLQAFHDMEVIDWLERDCRQTLDGRYILNSDPYTDICIYLDEKRNALFIHQDPPNASHFHFGLKMLEPIELGNRP